MPTTPTIPTNITVHLGSPNADAANVTVPFADYIKNVASSEIYPTWPESAIRANIYAQISYALNRIYTEYYPSRGYNFDITNSTTIDQSFVYGRDIFENISEIVDEIFNNYVVRSGNIEPLFTAYCDGREVNCNGLKQWGTVALAEQGLSPFEILQYYYGDDIEIVRNAPIQDVTQSWPGRILSLGLYGNDVSLIQRRLNRISKNYPAIPKIYPVNGVFSTETENAVREFQKILNLTQDGIVGKSTWYQIQNVFNAVKHLNDLESEGIKFEDISDIFDIELSEGDFGNEVRELQYLLSIIGSYEQEIPIISIDGIFGTQTKNAVEAFQRMYGLSITGEVNEGVWEVLYSVVNGIRLSQPGGYFDGATLPYPGYILRLGSQGEEVRALQMYLNYISDTYTQIPKVSVDGIYGQETERAVREYQRIFGLPILGIVPSRTWDSITSLYRELYDGNQTSSGQYPGYSIGG